MCWFISGKSLLPATFNSIPTCTGSVIDVCIHSTHSLTHTPLSHFIGLCSMSPVHSTPSNWCIRSSHSVVFPSFYSVLPFIQCEFNPLFIAGSHCECWHLSKNNARYCDCLLHRKKNESGTRQQQIQYCLHAMRFAYVTCSHTVNNKKNCLPLFTFSIYKRIAGRCTLFCWCCLIVLK